MGKKNKKQDKYDQDYMEEKPSLKLVLKMGGVPLTPDVGSDGLDDGIERSSKKKRKLQERYDSEDESEVSQKWGQQNFDDDDDEDFGKSRNPREKKINIGERTPLQCCLDHIQKVLQRKDLNGFFAFPVTDSIAPGYSNVIQKSMDFSTMKKKIDKGLYKSIAEYKSDFQLMMTNCMSYNHPDTIYHKEANRLLLVGSKHISKDRINQMRRNLSFMSSLSKEEISLDDDDNMDVSLTSDYSGNKTFQAKKDSEMGINRSDAITDIMNADDILRQVQDAANNASERLQILAPNSKMGYLKKKPDGTTTLSILNPDNSGIISPKERVVDLGGLIGRLSNGSDSITIPKEDKRNKITPVTYLNYGAFTSFAPVYDSSSANLDKDQSDLLLSTYGDETGLQYAKSLQYFVSNCGEYATSMVDELLNVLTNGMHSKTMECTNQINSTNNSRQDQQLVNVVTTEKSSAADDHLKKTSDLILNLREAQHSRLSQEHTTRVDNCKPSTDEINLANQVTSELTQLIKNVTPGDVVGVKELRHAMGVSLESFDGVANIEDIIKQSGTTVSSNIAQDVSNPAADVFNNFGQKPLTSGLQMCDVQSSSVVTNTNPGFQVLQTNIQDGPIMVGGNGQMILTTPSFNTNPSQVLVGSNFQNQGSYAVINTNNGNNCLFNAGGLQILQTNGQSSAQVVRPLIQGGNIYFQGDGTQLTASNLHANMQTDLNKLQPGSIVIQQPIYNTNISIGQQQPQLDQQFIIQ